MISLITIDWARAEAVAKSAANARQATSAKCFIEFTKLHIHVRHAQMLNKVFCVADE